MDCWLTNWLGKDWIEDWMGDYEISWINDYVSRVTPSFRLCDFWGYRKRDEERARGLIECLKSLLKNIKFGKN